MLRQEYRIRRDALYAALDAEMPDGVTWTRTDGGFFAWMTLAPGIDVEKVMAKAADETVVPLPGTGCFPDGQGTRNLWIGPTRGRRPRARPPDSDGVVEHRVACI